MAELNMLRPFCDSFNRIVHTLELPFLADLKKLPQKKCRPCGKRKITLVVVICQKWQL